MIKLEEKTVYIQEYYKTVLEVNDEIHLLALETLSSKIIFFSVLIISIMVIIRCLETFFLKRIAINRKYR